MSAAVQYVPIGLALFALQLDFFSLSLALPTIAADLHVPVTDLQWLLSGYLLSLGSLFVPAAKVGDLLGRRGVLMAGVVVFGVTSLACGLAADSTVLIVFRVLQGVGAALIMPNAFALMGATLRDDQRAKIMGLMLGVSGVGTALGPVVGGVLAASAGWRWVFFINFPIALVAVFGARRVAESYAGVTRGRLADMDWAGVVLIVLGLVGVSVAIDNVPTTGLADPLAWAPALAGLGLLWLFVHHEGRSPRPLVRPSLFVNRAYLAVVLAGTAANIGLNVYVFAATLQLQNVDHFSPAAAGAVFMLASLGLAVGGPASGWLTARLGAMTVLTGALLLGALAVVGVALSAGSLPLYVVALGVAGFTCGMGFSVSQIGIQAILPADQAGEGSSLSLTVIVAIGGIAVVVAGSVLDVLAPAPDAAALTGLLLGLAALLVIAGFLSIAWVARHSPARGHRLLTSSSPIPQRPKGNQ